MSINLGNVKSFRSVWLQESGGALRCVCGYTVAYPLKPRSLKVENLNVSSYCNIWIFKRAEAFNLRLERGRSDVLWNIVDLRCVRR